jgi:PAS domain S-box-containing protein
LSEDRYRSVVDNSPYGIYRVSYAGEFITVNPALCSTVGYSAEELFRAGIGVLYPDATDRARWIADYERRPKGTPVDVQWRRKDGSIITTRIWAYAERDAAGGITHSDGYVEDVTTLRATERALRQSEKLAAIGQLISGVAHELNNPLSAILLFAEDLAIVERPDDEREALDIIAQQARRSRAIVRDLLSFVRSRDVTRAPVCPRALLEQMGRTLQPQLQSMGVSFRIELPPEGAIHVDRAGIEQVITNLVINAAQSAGEGGTVWVRAGAEPAGYAIDIVDDGPGFTPDALPRMFEPFYTTKPMGQGTGLGLSVSLGIVQQHGGSITAENRAGHDGRGACVTVRLPSPAKAVAVESDCARDESEDSGDSILVA